MAKIAYEHTCFCDFKNTVLFKKPTKYDFTPVTLRCSCCKATYYLKFKRHETEPLTRVLCESQLVKSTAFLESFIKDKEKVNNG